MLTVCPTPIGNLGDTSQRQLEALRDADLIACEDTRVTGKLLELLGVPRVDGRPRLVSYHDHNERERSAEVIQHLLNGVRVTLVSDAGTPGIADPGYRLISQAQELGIEVVVLPGPCAAIVALVASGFPSDRFDFWGFLPPKAKARQDELRSWGGGTLVLYESPQRLSALLEDVLETHPESQVFVARELTKKFEEHFRGKTSDVLGRLQDKTLKGECVVVVRAPIRVQDVSGARDLTLSLVEEGLSPAQIKRIVSNAFGSNKSQVFEWMEEAKSKK